MNVVCEDYIIEKENGGSIKRVPLDRLECNCSKGPISEEGWASLDVEGTRREKVILGATQASRWDERPSAWVETRHRIIGLILCRSIVSVKVGTLESTRTDQIAMKEQPADLRLPLRVC